MKKVLSKSKVAHYWANQIQSEGRTPGSSNYFFDRATIYSYGHHFPIAVIHEKNGIKSVLFTTRTYSNTTAKHISETSSACSHMNKIYCYDPEHASKGYHLENIEQFEKEAKYIALNGLPKSKKPEIYLNRISNQRDLFLKYCDYFGLDFKKYYLTYIFIESKESGKQASEQELKKQAELRIKAEAQRKKDLAKAIKKFRAFKKAEAQRKKDLAKAIKKFRAFKSDQCYNSDLTLLRFNTETQRVETSKGVEIPLKTAKKAYKWVQSTLKGEGCTDCPYKILEYQVSELNSKFLVVGCHNIPMAEITRIAKQLNW